MRTKRILTGLLAAGLALTLVGASGSGSGGDDRIEHEIDLSPTEAFEGPGEGEAEFRAEPSRDRRRLDVELEDFAAEETFTVRADGVDVGEVTVVDPDGDGQFEGEMELRSQDGDAVPSDPCLIEVVRDAGTADETVILSGELTPGCSAD